MISCLDFLSFVLEWIYVFVLFKMIHTFLPLRKNLLLRWAAFFAGGGLFTVIIYSNDLAGLLGAFLGMLGYMAVFHQGHWVEKITAILVFYPAFIAVNYLMQDVGSRCFFFVTNAPGEMSAGWTKEQLLFSTLFHMLSLLLRLLFWILAWRILGKYLQQITWNLSVKMWLVIDVLMLAPFVAIFTMLYFMPENPLLVYPICGASVFSSFGCMYLASYICLSVQTRYRVQELELKQAYYQERIKEEERVRAVYHDMKNHLLVLEGQIQSQETAGMIQKLQQEVESYEDYVNTGSTILDIILREKAEIARKKQIDLSVAADLRGVDFMEPLDISTIFGNGLDNAIEASEKLTEEQRVILAKAGRVQNFFSVLIENNYAEEAKDRKKRTAKQDDFLHGFGILNMEKAVKKYHGQLVAKGENGKFTLKILIPISQ
ncbi:MAG: sensor histidine kinase [Lachnospiraceae bacterium]|nr:sensor histidine kinase [Lachnospiraceae bacterium]